MAIYTIKADDKILDDPRLEDRQVFEPKLTLEVNKVGELQFKIYDDHPLYNSLTKCKTILTFLADNKVIFKGRITEDTRDFNNGKQVDCEGILAFLNDSIQRPFSFQGSPTDFFEGLIENHNSQVEDFQKFKVGQVTVIDKNNYINRESSDYLKTWEVITTRLLDTLGGYLRIRYEEDGNYIDWLSDFAIDNGDGTSSKIVSTQKIEFGKNLLNFTQKVQAPLATAAILLGAKIKDEENDTEKRLTIEGLPDEELDDIVKKGDMIYSKSGVAQYGFIFAKVSDTTWDDVTVPENLYKKGKEFLSGDAIFLSETIELSAVDMKNLNKDIDNFNYCEYIEVESRPHGIGGLYLLSKITIHPKNPDNTKITLGTTQLTLTDQNLGINRQISDAVNMIQGVTKDYVLNTEIAEIRSEILKTMTAILQDSQNIVFENMEEYVSKGSFDEYRELIKTQFAQTVNAFTFLFDHTIEKITTLEGETQRQFLEQIKYIRFEDGNIIIGKVGNEITLVHKHNRIAFLQNNVEVAYFSNNKLFVTDVRILSSIQLGAFAIEVEDNGSVSMRNWGC